MAPIKVVIIHPGGRLDLVIPGDPEYTFAQFYDKVALPRASSRHGLDNLPSSSWVGLRLNHEEGFQIDRDDRIEDIMLSSDVLFVLTAPSTIPSQPTQSTASPPLNAFHIRVITPQAAQQNPDVRQIPLLSGTYSKTCTLREIRADIAKHLGVDLEESASSTLDLHTAESPLQPVDNDMTFQTLTDLIVNGVLPIYASERKTNPAADEDETKVGKDAMFKMSPHWELPSGQSERGSAAFLSCLRVFSHIVGTPDFTEFQQNEVLRLFHELSRYPPAVRALHILMEGKKPRPNECAVLVQSISAVLQELIPKSLIENDPRRTLEGTRLLFGLILYKMRPKPEEEEDSLAYLTSYHTADLKDVKTLKPVIEPVQTAFGLMDKATFALDESGPDLLSKRGDKRELRVAKLYGGVSAECSYYDADMLSAQQERSLHASGGLQNELKSLAKDLNYVAGLCGETKMIVFTPRALSGSNFPCLTLDHNGNNAVYIGPPPCAPPDRDKGIYKPLTGTEENIDANIVTQLLEPILQARRLDRTDIFDLLTITSSSREAASTELLMICVDCSFSMDSSSNFQEINDFGNESPAPSATSTDIDIEEAENTSSIDFSEVRDWMASHGSLDDILAIVKSSGRRSRAAARQVVSFLRSLISREVAYLARKEKEKSIWASYAYLSSRPSRQKMISLRRLLSGLNIFEEAACDFLEFRAKEQDYVPKSFVWSLHDPVPTIERPPTTQIDLTAEFSTPAEFICPIGQAVFKDPVTTADGFTFERRSIERWYRIRHSSPLTGLPVTDTTLRRNQPLLDQITTWVSASEIVLPGAPSSPKRLRSASTMFNTKLNLAFTAPTGSFTRHLSKSLSLADLHRVAYRGMRGAHSSFTLHTNGQLLESSSDTLGRRGLVSGSEIVITALTDSQRTPGAATSTEEMCLIKVYTPQTREDSSGLAYWVPRSTTLSMESVVFRFWRYQLAISGKWSILQQRHDLEVWSKLRQGGDEKYIGTRHHTWDALSTSFSSIAPTQLTEYDPIWKSSSDSGGASGSTEDHSDFDDTNGSGALPEYRVLKLELSKYESLEELEARRRRKLRTLTRMDISKQIFGSFVNRLIAYNYPTTVGLVTFGTTVSLTQNLTNTIENFRKAVDSMDTTGDTSLWDALALAAHQLNQYQKDHDLRNVRKRILCLSDGEDTKSEKTAHDVCRSLVESEIVVDSCSVGDEDNSDLRTVSYLTGGYKFVPKNLEDAVAVCELEPVLSQHERPAIVRPLVPALLTLPTFNLAKERAHPDPVSRDVFPSRKSHPNLDDSFVRIGAFERAGIQARPNTEQNTSGIRSRRLLTEIQAIAREPHPSYDVYVSEANMGFWKIVLSGPEGSAYETGSFLFYLDMGDEYPRAPPKGRFITPVFHPNINRHGRICHSIFDRNWTVDTTNKQILDTVFGLLSTPEFSDPINTVVTLDFYWDQVQFKEEVKKHIAKHARKSRNEMGMDILGDEDTDLFE